MNSWEKSDSQIDPLAIGLNDFQLMHILYAAGTEHRKYLRQIMISMDITAPLYWWKEFDTYKVGTTANSCSTMHTIHKKVFEMEDFSTDHLLDAFAADLSRLIEVLNIARYKYLETHDKAFWWQIIQLLPSSYNQKRTVTMSYENAVSIISQRNNHKLDEWRALIEALKTLPLIADLIGDA